MGASGSSWSKWDLHVHTPLSLRHNYAGTPDEAWEHFIKDLEALDPSFKVIGINDYIFLDGYKRVLQEKAKGRLPNIEMILPVIEFRISKFGGTESWSRINLHVIFDPKLTPEQIETYFMLAFRNCYVLTPEANLAQVKWDSIPTRESLTELGQRIIDSTPPEKRVGMGSPLQVGFNNLNADMANIEKALTEDHLRGRHLLAIGKTEWADSKWNDAHIAEKKHTINSATFVFTAAADPSAALTSRNALKNNGVNSKLLDCSDAHSYADSTNKDRIGNCWTWIKAEFDFRGLKYAALEYDSRVYIGDAPPLFARLAAQPNRFIESIEIHPAVTCPEGKRWFDVTIPINPGMTCIVGNKGSGKSALSDTMGMLGNAHCEKYFSFLDEKRFRKSPANLGRHFNATMKWRSGRTSTMDLMRGSRLGEREEVRYLPQHYLEEVCNEVTTGESLFEKELKRIIYYNLPESRRVGRQSLDDLVTELGEASDIELDAQRQLLEAINEKIAGWEVRLLPSTRQHYEARLEALNAELVAHESAPPPEVQKPEAASAAIQELGTQMQAAQAELTKLTSERATKEERASKVTEELNYLRRALIRLRDTEGTTALNVQGVIADVHGIFTDAEVRSWVKLEISYEPLKGAIGDRSKELQALRAYLDDKGDNGVAKRITKAQAAIEDLRNKLSEPERAYLVYTERLKEWENVRARLIGSPEVADSVQGTKEQLKLIESAQGILDGLYAERRAMVGNLFDIQDKFRAALGELYEAAKARLEVYKDQQLDVPIVFEVKLVDSGFSEAFLNMIHKGVKSAFLSTEAADTLITHLLQSMDCTSRDSVVRFVEDVLRNCREIKHEDGSIERIDVSKILRSGVTVGQVYDMVTSLEYLRPSFRLRFQDKDIRELSPGQRGMVLLLFYLLVDSDDVPLIVDQPEENLDNETVVTHLVKAFSVARERRQIIVVTHNANLAVVCDADQIIHAIRDDHDGPFQYESGALETSEITEGIVDVLEGTKPAFTMRSTKYSQ